jgi:transposase
MPSHLDLHLIGDNYATHKHLKVQRWLARDPRFHMLFTPTSASWLNMVERFFRDLTQNRLRRGVFHDLEELIMASTATTNIPKPSSGRPALPTFWRKSNAPAAPCINVNLHDALH